MNGRTGRGKPVGDFRRNPVLVPAPRQSVRLSPTSTARLRSLSAMTRPRIPLLSGMAVERDKPSVGEPDQRTPGADVEAARDPRVAPHIPELIAQSDLIVSPAKSRFLLIEKRL